MLYFYRALLRQVIHFFGTKKSTSKNFRKRDFPDDLMVKTLLVWSLVRELRFLCATQGSQKGKNSEKKNCMVKCNVKKYLNGRIHLVKVTSRAFISTNIFEEFSLCKVEFQRKWKWLRYGRQIQGLIASKMYTQSYFHYTETKVPQVKKN